MTRIALFPSLPVLAGSLLLATTASAQGLSLDKTGGGLGASVTMQVRGAPNSLYLILFALNEQTTPVPALGITLDIPDHFAGASMGVPGFYGRLSGTGTAQANVAIPNDPALATLAIPLQAIAETTPNTYIVSNLVRVTPQVIGTFAPSLNAPPVIIAGGGFATAPNNALLFVGGSGPVAQLYKSRTEEWEQAGTTFGVGILSQTTGLPDGRVLFTGGIDPTTGQPTTAAAIYDPVSGQTTTLTMAQPRAGHGASVMGNGRVLITGGFRTFNLADPLALFAGIQNTTEIFDPATGAFSNGPNMLEARALHSSSSLTGGNVLIAGGLSLIPIINIPTVSATAYRFNPATNSFGLPSTFSGGRFFHSAVGLSDGKVLLVGGINLDLSRFLQTGQIQDIIVATRTDCQLFSAGTGGLFGSFTTVNGMQEGRAGAAIAALPGGGALIAGGFQLQLDIVNSTFVFNPTASADRFAQGPNRITATGSMAAPRLFPISANLPDGTVMVVGGGPAAAEIYQY